MGRHPLRWREPLRWAPLIFGVLCLDVVGAVGLRLCRVHGAVGLDVRTAQPVFSHAFGVSLVPVRMATQFVKLGNPVPYAGLGLALAAWVVRAHGGHLAVESHVGVGTVFTVSLPLRARTRELSPLA